MHYDALAADPSFHLFVRASSELQTVDITPLNREERIAFFLNTYNVIIVHALAFLGPAKNFFERYSSQSDTKGAGKYNNSGLLKVVFADSSLQWPRLKGDIGKNTQLRVSEVHFLILHCTLQLID